MLSSIDFYIHDTQIELGGKGFLLGELTCDLLNITPEEFHEMWALVKQLETDESRKATRQLHALLIRRRIFQLMTEPDEYSDAETYLGIVSDIYSFNQTVFRFVDHFLMRLKKLDSENYAAALYDFYSHPNSDKLTVNHLRNGAHAFTLFDTVDVRYLPREVSGQPDTYAIYEVYSVNYLQAFLKMDFMKAVMTGHTFRRCKNCKRFFLLTQGYKTDYCDRPLADNPKRTCRQQGAKNTAKEKAKNNPVLQNYNKAYRRITADKSRGNITAEEWRLAKGKLADLRDMAISGRLRDVQAEQRMQSKELYASLGIIRKDKR